MHIMRLVSLGSTGYIDGYSRDFDISLLAFAMIRNDSNCRYWQHIGKSSESVQCAITGPCLRHSALYRFGRFAQQGSRHIRC